MTSRNKKIFLVMGAVFLVGFAAVKHQETTTYLKQLEQTQTSLEELSHDYQALDKRYQELATDFTTYKKDHEHYIELGKKAQQVEEEQKAQAQRLNKEQEQVKEAAKQLEEEKANLQKERDNLKQEQERLQAEKNQWQQAQATPPVQAGFANAAPVQSVYYPNCRAARAAGAAPVYAGQPGYGAHLDRDGDGVGCE